MSVYEFLAGGGLSLVGFLTLIQIAPIKVNPWTKIAKAIGNTLMKDTSDQIKELREEVKAINDRQIAYENITDEDKMDACRSRILRFGDECRRELKHSREFFDQILEDITRYEHYCDTHPEYENSKAVLTIEKIKKIYNKCDEDDSFL